MGRWAGDEVVIVEHEDRRNVQRGERVHEWRERRWIGGAREDAVKAVGQSWDRTPDRGHEIRDEDRGVVIRLVDGQPGAR